MRKIILLALLLVAVGSKAQKNSDACSMGSLLGQLLWFDHKAEPVSQLFLGDYDFAPLWLDKRTCYLGFVGNDYYRVSLIFTEIKKQSPGRYTVKGRTQKNKTIRNFTGEITIIGLAEFAKTNKGVDDFVPAGGVSREGYILGEFSLRENTGVAGTGEYKGHIATGWYIDGSNRLKYDDILFDSDKYCNNLIQGSWTSYKSKETKKFSWGHYRVPCSGDLDEGAGEFAVSPQYRDKGWGSPGNYCVN